MSRESERKSPEKTGDRRISGIVMIVCAASMWGSWPLCLRFADRFGPIPSTAQTVIVMSTLTVISFGFVLGDRLNVKATPLEWFGVAWLGVGDALNICTFFYAYKIASVAVSVLTHDLGPLLVALAAPIFLRERVRAATFAAIALALVGLVFMLRPWEEAPAKSEISGAFYGFLSAIFYASNVLLNKKLTRSFSGSELMAWHGVVATPLLFAIAGVEVWSHVSRGALVALVVIGAGPGTLAGLLFAWGVRRIDASLAATIALLEPVVAIILSVLVLEQRLGLLGALGVGFVLAGAFLVARAPAKLGATRKPL